MRLLWLAALAPRAWNKDTCARPESWPRAAIRAREGAGNIGGGRRPSTEFRALVFGVLLEGISSYPPFKDEEKAFITSQSGARDLVLL